MNDHETTVLSSRLHHLADVMTPQLDVVAQVRAARTSNRRRRRGRIAFLSVATATAAAAVGTVVAVDAFTADRGAEVARPTSTAPPPVVAPVEPTAPVTDWETRTFEGVTVVVPPGARAADTVDTRPVTSLFEGPSLTWNGPRVSGDLYSEVQILEIATYEGGLYPADGGQTFTVAGADAAYGGIYAVRQDDGTGVEVDTTTASLYVLEGDRQFRVSGVFPGGDAGREMAERVIASVAVTPAAEDDADDADDVHQPSTAWESRTLQGITFSVPPGSRAPEYRSDSTLIWYGPAVGGQDTFITLDVTPLLPGQSVGDGYAPTTVPGAQEAWVMTDLGTINPGLATFNVWMHDGSRNINLGGTLPLGPGSEETVRRVIESVVIG